MNRRRNWTNYSTKLTELQQNNLAKCFIKLYRIEVSRSVANTNNAPLYVEFIDKLLSKATIEQLDIIYRLVLRYLND